MRGEIIRVITQISEVVIGTIEKKVNNFYMVFSKMQGVSWIFCLEDMHDCFYMP